LHEHHLAALGRTAEEWTLVEQVARALMDVGLDAEADEVLTTGTAPERCQRGLNLLEQRLDVRGRRLLAGRRSGHRAALLVAEDDEDFHGEMVHGVLHPPEGDGIGDVARHADDEEITEVVIEDDLRAQPAVRAGEYYHVRLLPLGQRAPPRGQRA